MTAMTSRHAAACAALARSHTLSRRLLIRARACAWRREADLPLVSLMLADLHQSRPNRAELVADLKSRLRSLLKQRRQRDVEARLDVVRIAYLAEASRLREARRFQRNMAAE